MVSHETNTFAMCASYTIHPILHLIQWSYVRNGLTSRHKLQEEHRTSVALICNHYKNVSETKHSVTGPQIPILMKVISDKENLQITDPF